jgi:hypothetical protein
MKIQKYPNKAICQNRTLQTATHPKANEKTKRSSIGNKTCSNGTTKQEPTDNMFVQILSTVSRQGKEKTLFIYSTSDELS